MAGSADALGIEHVFVLMLENRSFDHLLGFSGIAGSDAVSGQPAAIDGLTGSESSQGYPVTPGADFCMPADPDHEFTNVLEQLCGPGAQYPKAGAYPLIDNGGYVASWLASGNGLDPKEIMKCYAPDQLPVLNALAREFVLCDNWFSALPGPTWPNRMFVHAASSNGLDHSPTTAEIAEWEAFDGFSFPKGDIFDRLKTANVTRCLYGGDDFPMIAALKGISLSDIRHYSQFAGDLAEPNYRYTYVFIEPAYDVLNDYKSGNSEHPQGDITAGEALIKQTYEAIRNSDVWNNSVLIVTWDEHGGFYDHATPPQAVAPADGADPKYNQNGFTFEQSGVRVPAIVVSPRIPKNLIDSRIYDHSCIPKFLEDLFGLPSLTERDSAAANLADLITLAAPRTDAPVALPAPANSAQPKAPEAAATVARPNDSVNGGNLPAVVHSAMQQDLKLNPENRPQIVSRVASMQTRADAAQYLQEVQQKVSAAKTAAAGGN